MALKACALQHFVAFVNSCANLVALVARGGSVEASRPQNQNQLRRGNGPQQSIYSAAPSLTNKGGDDRGKPLSLYYYYWSRGMMLEQTKYILAAGKKGGNSETFF